MRRLILAAALLGSCGGGSGGSSHCPELSEIAPTLEVVPDCQGTPCATGTQVMVTVRFTAAAADPTACQAASKMTCGAYVMDNVAVTRLASDAWSTMLPISCTGTADVDCSAQVRWKPSSGGILATNQGHITCQPSMRPDAE